MDGLLRKESTRVEEERRAVEVFDELGFRGFDLGRPVWTLSLADKQIVTVVRALVRPWRLLILDESTSALDREVRDRLFGLLARSIASGDRAIVFTTHRLDEVEQFADSATVLRAGATAGILSREELSRGRILELMSSRQLSTRAAEKETSSQVLPPTRWVGDVADVLRAEDLVLRPGGRRFSLSLHTGEIFGVTGLEGQGQVRLLECTAGLQKPFAGQVLVTRDGELTHVRGYRDAYRKGVVYVPRDRKQEGLFLVQSVFNNLALPVLGRFSKAGLIRRQQVVEWLTTYTKQLSLDTARLNSPVGSLSGGNQQKVLLGRWMAVNPVVFVLNDPLRGVDEVTKQELYEVFRALALQGLTILFLSTEISELLTLCERVAVFWDSGLEAVITGAELTEQSIIDAMFGRGPATEAERA
jgi:ribose transport system ATP-binding protein